MNLELEGTRTPVTGGSGSTATDRPPTSRTLRVRGAVARAVLSTVAVSLVACGRAYGSRTAVGADPSTASAVDVLEAQLDAFNAHDAAALADLVSEDFVWLSVQGDSVAVAVRGRAGLREAMEGYFESLPSVSSTLESMVGVGPYVAVRERARWKDDEGGTRSQASLAVYRIEEGRIRRVWYFPAVGR